MKKLILIFICCFSGAQAQRAPQGLPTISLEKQKQTWIGNIRDRKLSGIDLTPENLKKEYLKHNFSTLFIPGDQFIGFIGTDYERIKVVFTEVSKSDLDPGLYHITGVSVVKDNKCDFKGIIRISEVRELRRLQPDVNTGFQKEGLLIGDYEFREDSSQRHVGIFSGMLTLYWNMDKHDILHIDEFEKDVSDSYCNNLYAGTWKEYGKNESTVCNWGMYRIPFSGDLDVGAGEFSPNPNYFEKGWKDYKAE
jgi:hypothetical protein